MSDEKGACLVQSPGLAVVALLALPVSAQVTPSVTVEDQAIVDGTVTAASVVSDGPGWIVIHRRKAALSGRSSALPR